MSISDLESRIQRLEDESALTKLINTYTILPDAFRWVEWADLFTDDAEFRLENSFGVLKGKQEIHDVCKGNMDHVYDDQQHYIVNVDVTINGDTATGTANLVFIGLPDKNDPVTHFMGGGRYAWKFRRTADGWRISDASLRFIWNNGVDEDGVFVPVSEK